MRSNSNARVGESLSTKVSFLNIDKCISCAIGGGGTIDGNGPAWWFNRSASRPKLISIDHSRDFALWNFTATDGGDHTIELGADDVEVAHMEIVMDWTKALPPGLLGGIMAPNTDGIDVHGTPFYVHHTHIDVGDDNVAVHASDVLVEDCHFGGDAVGHGEVHGHGASIGSIGSGVKLQNITFRRIFFENTHVGPNIKIHGDATDGYVRNVTYEDLVIHNATVNNLIIHTDYSDEGQLAAPTPPTSGNSGSAFTVSNVLFKNITATGTYKQGGFSCSEKVKCENITMIEVHTDGKKDSYVCTYTTGSAKDVSPKIPCLHSYS
jgi:polygalacturonase